MGGGGRGRVALPSASPTNRVGGGEVGLVIVKREAGGGEPACGGCEEGGCHGGAETEAARVRQRVSEAAAHLRTLNVTLQPWEAVAAPPGCAE